MAMMSFLSSLRLPENAASEATNQWLQYDDLFDQLIESEPDSSFGRATTTGASRNAPEPRSSPSFIQYLEGRSANCNSTSAGHYGSPQLGGGDKFIESQRFEPAVPQPMDATRPVSCEAPNMDPFASDSLPFHQSSSPISPPLTENNSSFGGSVKSVLSGGVKKVYRKGSISPTRMTHPSFSRRHTDWAQKLEASADGEVKAIPRHNLWSPPPSDRIPQWDDSMAFDQSSLNQSSRPGSYHQSQASMNSNSHRAGASRHQSRTLPSQRQTPASTPYSTSSSTFDSLITSPQVEGPLGWDSSPFTPFQQYSVDGSPTPRQYDDSKVQPWFPSNQSAVAFPSYAQPVYAQRHSSQQSDHVPTLPSQDSYGTSASSSQGMAGLGINTTAGFDSASFPVYSTSDPAPRGYPLSTSRSQQLPRRPHHRHGSDRQRSSSSSSSSSPSSPVTQPCASTLTTRRAPRAAQSASSRRSKSQGSAPGAAAAAASSVGFVNFTPSDSRRILTGVAPSGSSKTKARREKEAADRRRRLSQAAARAVLEAGGDVAALEREGLLGFA